jgi:isopenicillin-N epimerase
MATGDQSESNARNNSALTEKLPPSHMQDRRVTFREIGLCRRDFLVRTGLMIGAGALAVSFPKQGLADLTPPPFILDNWDTVRAQFNLRRDRIHMAGFLLASHPKPVREAIETHRRGFDESPAEYFHDNRERAEGAVLSAAADYMGVQPADIALTDSTTMGLGLLYGGLTLRPGQEILSTIHDHYSTAMSLRLRAKRTGASFRQIPLYQKLETVSQAEIVDTLIKAMRPETRIVALTWVHSSTGLKLPIRHVAEALGKVNEGRSPEDRALLCVDGVHGFGVEDVRMADLGCDFFIAGCHKWIFGPRGTGLVWGKPAAWPVANAIIPPFSREMYQIWLKQMPIQDVPPDATMTPGGFHSFEHRWSLGEAFRFHLAIGKARIAARIHTLNRQLKEGLAEMKHVKLHTPMADELSAGIVCFDVDGLSPEDVVAGLYKRAIIASVTPYATRYARLSPSLLTSPKEVDATLGEIRNLGQGAV